MASERQRELAARILQDQAFWRGIADEVGRDRMGEPGVDGEWTFRDVAAHLAAWRNYRIPIIEAAAAGAAEPPKPWPEEIEAEDVDRVNDWFQARDVGRSLDEVLEDYDGSFERLATAIESLPEALALDPNAMAWTGGEALVDLDFTEHLHEEHLPGIRAWLARTGSIESAT